MPLAWDAPELSKSPVANRCTSRHGFTQKRSPSVPAAERKRESLLNAFDREGLGAPDGSGWHETPPQPNVRPGRIAADFRLRKAVRTETLNSPALFSRRRGVGSVRGPIEEPVVMISFRSSRPRWLLGSIGLVVVASVVALGQSVGPRSGEDPSEIQPADPKLPEGVVARVDGVDIPHQDYLRFLERELGYSYFREFIDDHLLQRKANELGVVVTEDEIARRADEQIRQAIDARHQGDEAVFRRSLATRLHTLESFRLWTANQLRGDALLEACIRRERAPTEVEVRERFERMYGEGGVHFQVRHIQITRRADDADGSIARAAADEIMKELEVDPSRFASLVQERSDDRFTQRNDGLIPNYRSHTFGEAFDRAVRGLDSPGQVVGPIPSSRGFHVIQLVRRTTTPFDEVRSEIEALLIAEPPAATERHEYRRKLRREAKVER